jgi:hypothetical protein
LTHHVSIELNLQHQPSGQRRGERPVLKLDRLHHQPIRARLADDGHHVAVVVTAVAVVVGFVVVPFVVSLRVLVLPAVLRFVGRRQWSGDGLARHPVR